MVIISRNHLRNVIQQIRNGRAIFEYILGSDCLAKKNEKLGKSSEMGFSISKLKWVRFLYVSSSNIASEKGVYNKNSVGQKNLIGPTRVHKMKKPTRRARGVCQLVREFRQEPAVSLENREW